MPESETMRVHPNFKKLVNEIISEAERSGMKMTAPDVTEGISVLGIMARERLKEIRKKDQRPFGL